MDAISFYRWSEDVRYLPERSNTYLLVRVHRRETTSAALASLLGCCLNVLLGAVGEVAGIIVAGHIGEVWFSSVVR
jgi:hypothetical protein